MSPDPILRNRRGDVAELVDAERSVAAAQEELDQTRAWLAELRGRVALLLAARARLRRMERDAPPPIEAEAPA